MNISGSTVIVVNGKQSRVCGSVFNTALRKLVAFDGSTRDGTATLAITDTDGNALVPSKNLSWLDVSAAIRQGKKVACKVDAPKKSKPRKTSSLYALEPEGEGL